MELHRAARLIVLAGANRCNDGHVLAQRARAALPGGSAGEAEGRPHQAGGRYGAIDTFLSIRDRRGSGRENRPRTGRRFTSGGLGEMQGANASARARREDPCSHRPT
jgi:hypothetical protein